MAWLDMLFRNSEKEINEKSEDNYVIDENKVNLILQKLTPQHIKEEILMKEKEYIFPSELVIEEGNIDIYNLTKELRNSEKTMQIPIMFGKDKNGKIVFDDLRELKNILIAGATGTGKSMLLHSIITTIICTTSPDILKLVLIDYKSIEFSMYNGLPNLLIPVVTDVRKSIGVLGWAVQEMNNRYDMCIKKGVRDVYAYNQITNEEKIPEILIVIDDILDMMRFSPIEAGQLLEQLFSKSKNTGIHIIISSQSAAKTIIPESVKSNILNRISFKVVSSKESIAILDEKGAELITEVGTMLYKKYNSVTLNKVNGINIEIKQIQKIIENIRKNNYSEYDINTLTRIEESFEDTDEDDTDIFLMEAIEAVVELGQASASFIQRRFKVGYARAGKIIDQMEEKGIVSGYEGSKPREVLINEEEWKRIKEVLEI